MDAYNQAHGFFVFLVFAFGVMGHLLIYSSFKYTLVID